MPVFYTFHNLRFKDTITKEETQVELMSLLLDFLYEDGEPVDDELPLKRFYHTEEEGFCQEILDTLQQVFGDKDGLWLFTMIDEWQLCKWDEQGDKVIPLNGLALSNKMKKGIYMKKEYTSNNSIMDKPSSVIDKLKGIVNKLKGIIST